MSAASRIARIVTGLHLALSTGQSSFGTWSSRGPIQSPHSICRTRPRLPSTLWPHIHQGTLLRLGAPKGSFVSGTSAQARRLASLLGIQTTFGLYCCLTMANMYASTLLHSVIFADKVLSSSCSVDLQTPQFDSGASVRKDACTHSHITQTAYGAYRPTTQTWKYSTQAIALDSSAKWMSSTFMTCPKENALSSVVRAKTKARKGSTSSSPWMTRTFGLLLVHQASVAGRYHGDGKTGRKSVARHP